MNHFLTVWLVSILPTPAIALATAEHNDSFQNSSIAVTHVNVVDVVKGKIIPDQTILMESNRIIGVLPARHAFAANQYKVVDAKGKFAIPGLWDMHIHWYHKDSMQLFPLNGVTGVRFMWGYPMHHGWRKEFVAGKSLGPRMMVGSTIVDGSNPIWNGSIVAKDSAGGVKAVESALASNSDFVKVYSLLSRDAYYSIAKTCKQNKLPFGGHVPEMISIREASEAGQVSMEHMYGLMIACSSKEKELRDELFALRDQGTSIRKLMFDRALRDKHLKLAMETYDPEKARELFEVLKKNNTYQCPTLTMYRNIAFLTEKVVQENENLKYIPPFIRSTLAPKSPKFKRSPESILVLRKSLKSNFKILKAMNDAGVPILAGTDCLNPFCLPGFSLCTELELMVQAGLSPADALKTATVHAARFQNKGHELGQIQKGFLADLVLLDENPLQKISNVKKIDTVFINGRMIDSAQRKKLLDAQIRE